MAPQSLASYDQVPYMANPLPQTHPSRVAAVASMFGLSYVPPRKARVLELGCASGVNLLGMAHHMPEAKFVGIDLSIVQILEAQRRAGELGAPNVSYHHMGIEDVDAKFGEFDYIICHGVYSWVPAHVQKAIMRICNENMSEDGIAFVSYNVQPGWRMKQIARDTFAALTSPEWPALQRHEHGVAWMKDLLELTAKDEKRPLLHQALANELEQILTQKDFRYLAHEYLETSNEPMLFREFYAQAQGAGLAYLGDAEPASMIRHLSNSKLREFFGSHPVPNMAETEQVVDIIMGRTFRQSLLVKGLRGRQIKRQLSAEMFRGLHVQTRITKKTAEDGQAGYAHPRAGKIGAQPPYGTAAMDAMTEAGAPTAFTKLAERFAELSQGGSEAIFSDALFSMLGAGVIDILAEPVLDGPPKGASPMALLDIASGRNMTVNYFGEVIALDPVQMLLLPLMKGEWSRKEAIAALEAMYAKGAFNVDPAPPDKASLQAILGTMIDQAALVLKTVGLVG